MGICIIKVFNPFIRYVRVVKSLSSWKYVTGLRKLGISAQNTPVQKMVHFLGCADGKQVL